MSEHESTLINENDLYQSSNGVQNIQSPKILKSQTKNNTHARTLINRTPYNTSKSMVYGNTTNDIPIPKYKSTDSIIDTSCLNSVYVEQGDYFFDDEFGHLANEDLNDSVKFSLMTQSMNCDSCSNHRNSQPLEQQQQLQSSMNDQSFSDSCLFSDTILKDGQQSNTMNNNYDKHIPYPSQDKNNEYSKYYNPYTLIQRSLIDDKSFLSDTKYSDQTNDEMNPDGHKFLNGSQTSISLNRSSSTSWIQMLMDHSCNPELRALINRTAAAVDYKLAYGEPNALQRQFDERYMESLKYITPNMTFRNRSLSQGNLLGSATLTSLHNHYVPNQKEGRNEHLTVCSIGVSADLIPNPTVPETINKKSPEIANSNTTTTTWAKKHGSRESLKHRSRTTMDITTTDTALSLQMDTKDNLSAEKMNKDSWNKIKEANGALITWNQLKRSVKRVESFGKISSVRESRRDRIGTNQGISISALETQAPNRSHSQPLSKTHHMHRYSGTLLEIFMRAKIKNIVSSGACSDESAVNLIGSMHRSTNQTDGSKFQPMDKRFNRVSDLKTSNLLKSLDTNGQKEKLAPHGTRILPGKQYPSQLSSLFTTTNGLVLPMRNFGAQFPPLDGLNELNCKTVLMGASKTGMANRIPIWSNKLPSRNDSPMTAALLHYYQSVRRSHPQPLYSTRPQSDLNQLNTTTTNNNNNNGLQTIRPDSSSTQCSSPSLAIRQPGHIAACLTASAGPDSPYMAAVRAGCVAQGYAVGWLGNPRTIAYPGLGLLSVPRPSRLAGHAFLSHTLPDLSFLSQAGAEEDRLGTPTMSKQHAWCLCGAKSAKTRICKECGCSSFVARYRSGGVEYVVRKPNGPRHVSNPIDLVNGTKLVKQGMKQDLRIDHHHHHVQCHKDVRQKFNMNYPNVVNRRHFSTDNEVRLTSELEVNENQSHPVRSSSRLLCSSVDSTHFPWNKTSGHRYCRYHQSNGSNNLSASSSFIFNECDRHCEMDSNKPKKSVSFSGNIRLSQLYFNRDIRYHDSTTLPSPEPKVIPRNWGLYGQEQPLAEFNPRTSPGWDNKLNSTLIGHSDVDLRYHAMVNDVIKAVQETIAYYCHVPTNENFKLHVMRSKPMPNDHGANSKFESLVGNQSLLSIVVPLTILLCDGLLPPTKPIFTSRPRTRLWQMVEESCRPGALPAGVAYHVLNDAISQVKSITNITLEKTKFKAFVCACLNAKALPMWLNSVVANDALMKRFYCENAFVRQCRTVQRGLYADLITHLEQLLAFPFNLDISIEARKPVPNHDYSQPNTSQCKSNRSNSPNGLRKPQMKFADDHRSGSPAKVNQNRILHTTVPPPTCITRKKLIHTSTTFQMNIPTTTSTVQSPSSVTLLSNSTNHSNTRIPSITVLAGQPSDPHHPPIISHYSQHHLPAQRPTMGLTNYRNPEITAVNSNSRIPSKPMMSLPTTNQRLVSNVDSPLGANSSTHSQVRGRLKSALSNFKRGTMNSFAAAAAFTPSEQPSSSTSSSNSSSGKNIANHTTPLKSNRPIGTNQSSSSCGNVTAPSIGTLTDVKNQPSLGLDNRAKFIAKQKPPASLTKFSTNK